MKFENRIAASEKLFEKFGHLWSDVAAVYGIAEVHRALVVVPAVHVRPGNALAVFAVVVGGTEVQVVTGQVVGQVETTLGRLAGVGGADVVIVAVRDLPGHTDPVGADVAGGAQISVLAVLVRYALERPERKKITAGVIVYDEILPALLNADVVRVAPAVAHGSIGADLGAILAAPDKVVPAAGNPKVDN